MEKNPPVVASDPARSLTKRRCEGVKHVDDATRPLLSKPIADLGTVANLDKDIKAHHPLVKRIFVEAEARRVSTGQKTLGLSE